MQVPKSATSQILTVREAKYWDHVSYRGPRSMVTVDMSVDSRLTDGRYLGRALVATRSVIGDDSVDVVPLWQSSYRPRWLSADIDRNTPTLHRHITDTSSIFHRLLADSIGRYIGRYSIDMFFRHFFLISIDIHVHRAPQYRSSYQ